jgi:hypothetical protein
MSDPIIQLTETLLRAGVSPAAARRYGAELSDHRDDLVEHLEGQGMDPAAARTEAMKRLGSSEQLALPMLLDRRNRSLAARWPVLFFACLPLLVQVLASALPVVLLGLMARRFLPDASLPDVASVIAISWLILPVAIGWKALAAARRRCRLTWPLLGAVGGVVLATALQLDVAVPVAGGAGSISVAFGMPALLPLLVLMALVLLPLYLRPPFETLP